MFFLRKDFPESAVWKRPAYFRDGEAVYEETPIRLRLIKIMEYEQENARPAIVRIFLVEPRHEISCQDIIHYRGTDYSVRQLEKKFDFSGDAVCTRCMCGSVMRRWGYR